jgi:hypothetical protein
MPCRAFLYILTTQVLNRATLLVAIMPMLERKNGCEQRVQIEADTLHEDTLARDPLPHRLLAE